MTHLDDENLSALLDGEAGTAAAEMQAHVASCPECGNRLKRLQDASTAFRRSGAAAMPAGLVENAKAEAALKPRTPLPKRLALVLAWYVAAMLFIWISGAALKRTMPGLFSQVQAMISGAASSMGSGPTK